MRNPLRFIYPPILALLALAIAGCADPPPRRVRHIHAEPVSQPAPPPSTQVFFYPTSGQSPEQQDRDRYECYLWAVKQSGFDPSQPRLAPHQRVEYVPMPAPGRDTVAGAVTGAAVGAAVSRDAGKGAVVGAMAGAVLGAASDSAREEQAHRVQERYDRRDAERTARLEQQADAYRRAMGACLEGRGYAVK